MKSIAILAVEIADISSMIHLLLYLTVPLEFL